MAHPLLSQRRMPKHRIARIGAVVGFLSLCAGSVDAATPIALVWDRSPDPVTGYLVMWGTQSGQYTQSLNVGNTTTTSILPTTANRVYYFAVKAYNSSGTSAPSPEVAAWYGVLATMPALATASDFDGDGRADAMVYRGTTGEWFANKSTGGVAYSKWGAPALGDVPVPADYDGDGKADVAVYRGSSGQWFLSQSRNGAKTITWGAPALQDVPVPADYDGDGRADVAIYRRTTGEWFISQSSNGQTRRVTWGATGSNDVPVPGDYNGNGKADLAVFRRSTGQWFVLFDNQTTVTWGWGSAALGDVPVPADYDGDGKTDIGIFRETSGAWVVRLSSNNSTRTLAWGAPTLSDVPVPGDYDGDGKADIAVFRSSTGSWYIAFARGGSSSFAFGAPALGDTIGGGTNLVVLPL